MEAETSGTVRAPSRWRRWRRRTWRVVRWGLFLLVGYYVFAVLMLMVYRWANPPITGLQLQRRVEAVVARREYEPRRRYRSMENISRHVPRAVVAAEDGRFYQHRGFDVEEMRKAAREAMDGGRRRGASTITQQLMKNLFGCTCRNPVRKAYDLALTPAAELILSKERILELYLNNVEWGRGVWGVDAAARHYYGVTAGRLNRTQAAGLAALLPAPRTRTIANSAWYRAIILRRMSTMGW